VRNGRKRERIGGRRDEKRGRERRNEGAEENEINNRNEFYTYKSLPELILKTRYFRGETIRINDTA
jgi:hypothetical protein